MNRKLASIVRIKDIQPIPNADAIEVATVKGWKVVVKKGDFKVGDLAVYFEIDSFLPIKPEFEFLRKSCYRKMGEEEGFRLKTIKLRNQVSQGLIIPLDFEAEEGDDVTEKLGVKKFDPPIPAELAGVAKGNFPSFFNKTDEIRIQSLNEEDFYGKKCYISQKCDGSNINCYFNNGEFGVCSRNLELEESDSNTFWKMAKNLNLRQKLANLGQNIALQGELVGEGINGNKDALKGHFVYFFTVFDIDKQERLPFAEMKKLLKELDLEMVPILESDYTLPCENLTEFMLDKAEGKSILNPQKAREGIVVRGMNNEFSFKAISNKYLLKHGE